MENNINNIFYKYEGLVRVVYEAVKKDNSSLDKETMIIKSNNHSSISDLIKFDKNFINNYMSFYEDDVEKFNQTIKNKIDGSYIKNEKERLERVKKSISDIREVIRNDSPHLVDYIDKYLTKIDLSYYQKP